MKFKSPYLVRPHHKVHLADYSTSTTGDFKNKDQTLPLLERHRDQLDKLQDIFYATQQHALLIVLQGMDTSGKDGTIRHIFSGINPQGCDVTSFKVPTPLEARHDFLWRAHSAVPPRGMIGIFNRSHYEDVLVTRVHGQISNKQARERLDGINRFEAMLTENKVVIIKFFLHISHAEQGRRLQERIDDPDKRWKLSLPDFHERKFWPQYTSAYEDLLAHTSKKHSPWFIIPADNKWYRNVAISGILVDAMKALKLKYPAPTIPPKTLKTLKP